LRVGTASTSTQDIVRVHVSERVAHGLGGRRAHGLGRRIRAVKVNLLRGLGEQHVHVGSVGCNGSATATTALATRRSHLVHITITIGVVVLEEVLVVLIVRVGTVSLRRAVIVRRRKGLLRVNASRRKGRGCVGTAVRRIRWRKSVVTLIVKVWRRTGSRIKASKRTSSASVKLLVMRITRIARRRGWRRRRATRCKGMRSVRMRAS
jgi:hypothetical protein